MSNIFILRVYSKIKTSERLYYDDHFEFYTDLEALCMWPLVRNLWFCNTQAFDNMHYNISLQGPVASTREGPTAYYVCHPLECVPFAQGHCEFIVNLTHDVVLLLRILGQSVLSFDIQFCSLHLNAVETGLMLLLLYYL